jgi:RNA ligase (TIGR02306 family)
MLNDELNKELQPEILERKLASVQEILDVQPIPEADRIETAKVEGWTVVVPKGQVKPGDKVVYFEIDSFLPIRPEFEFLRDSSYKKDDFLGEGMRLKTRRLRGVYSQGLIMPLSDLGLPENLEVDTDLTEILGVKKIRAT